jgi:3-oxoacyl-[acyl-carrier protein] reductase
MDKFDSISIGTKAEVIHKITEKDIENFVSLTGDNNPLHVDSEYAQNTEYKKNVVHGMLSASFISTLIGTKLPGDGALWFSQTINFLSPVWVGDEIVVTGEVIQKSESQRTLKIKIDIVNQHKQKVIEGECLVKVVKEVSGTREKDSSVERKTVLVIGGTGGIGSSIVNRMAEAGYNVAFSYYSSEKGATELVNSLKKKRSNAISVKTDIKSERDIKNLLSTTINTFGSIDVIVNTATEKIIPKKFQQVEWDSIQEHFNNQVKGLYLLSKEAIPYFETRKKGKVICISSIYADGMPPKELFDYVIAKAALNAFVKSLAVEYGPKGITFNLVSPSMTQTSLITDVPEKTKILNSMQTPLRRLANPEDVAGIVAFLAGSDSDFLTGENIRVTGGQVMI